MLKKILIIAFLTNLVFLFPNAFAIDCKLCSVGACFCNITECSTGSISIYLTPNKCTGIPIKEFTFKNSSFVWIDAQAKNYYFQAFCDLGTKSNCTNVDLTPSTTTTSTTTSFTISTTTTFQKLACLFDCCVGETQYYNKYCDEGYECVDNQCVTTTTTTTTTTENPPQIPYSLIGGVVILILIAVFVYYFFKGREPKEKWSELYNKYGKR
jgi:hypothetical protein